MIITPKTDFYALLQDVLYFVSDDPKGSAGGDLYIRIRAALDELEDIEKEEECNAK